MAPFDKRQWESFYLLLDAGAEPGKKMANGSSVTIYATMNRPDIAHEVVKKYGYSGDLDDIAWILISAIEVGLPEEERRNFLIFLETERNVDVNAVWKAVRENNAKPAQIKK
jgi:hypothetical protein